MDNGFTDGCLLDGVNRKDMGTESYSIGGGILYGLFLNDEKKQVASEVYPAHAVFTDARDSNPGC